MLKQIARPNNFGLLEQLTPGLVVRARAFSQPARQYEPTQPVLGAQAAPLIHSRIRDQIMAQTKSRRALPDSTKDKYNTSLAQIVRAMKSRNLVSALNHWQALEDYRNTLSDGEAYRLPDATIKDLHKLFVSQFDKLVRIKWTESMKTTSKNFALQAAKHHAAEGLSILMLHYILQSDSKMVTRIYNECLETLGTGGLVPPETEEDSLALSEEEDPSLSRLDPGLVSVLLAVMTAHAMDNSFKPAFDTYLSSGIHIRTYRKHKFFQHLANNPSFLRKVETFLQRVNVASIVSRPPSLSKHIMNISHPRTAHSLEKLYHNILDGIFGPEPYLAADPSTLSDTRVVALTEAGWTTFQTGFIRCERLDLAAKVWDDLAAAGITPGVTMWTGLLDNYADLRNSNQAMITWNMMLERGVQPDVLTYRAIIAALFEDNNAAEALRRFAEYQNTLGDRDILGLTVYNTVLRGLLRLNRSEDAGTLLADMLQHGPQPDIVSYNTFLAYHGRQKNFKGLANTIAQMGAANIAGDVVTFSTVLSALLAVGRKDATSTILNLMRRQGTKPSVATYTAIIDHQMREQTEANLDAALALLDKMEQVDGIKPNEVTYTSILSGLYRGQWVSPGRANEVRKQIVSRMRREKLAFRLPTYNILIRAALDSEDEKGYLDALGLIEEMEKQDIPRVGNTWYILFAGLMKRGLWDVAHNMVLKMYNKGHEPSQRLKQLVTEILRKNRH